MYEYDWWDADTLYQGEISGCVCVFVSVCVCVCVGGRGVGEDGAWQVVLLEDAYCRGGLGRLSLLGWVILMSIRCLCHPPGQVLGRHGEGTRIIMIFSGPGHKYYSADITGCRQSYMPAWIWATNRKASTIPLIFEIFPLLSWLATTQYF